MSEFSDFEDEEGVEEPDVEDEDDEDKEDEVTTQILLNFSSVTIAVFKIEVSRRRR